MCLRGRLRIYDVYERLVIGASGEVYEARCEMHIVDIILQSINICLELPTTIFSTSVTVDSDYLRIFFYTIRAEAMARS